MFSSRKLTEMETETLKNVFGDQVDYSKIRIRDKHWTTEVSGARAFVFGNSIQMSGKYIGDRTILIHETAHVWQFQHTMGWEYIFSALTDHILARLDGHNPYDYSKVLGTAPWHKWSVEQQAQWIGEHECLPPFDIRFPKGRSASAQKRNSRKKER
ncbi:MAG: hypothetical protein WCX65_02660 [bacterium]